MLQEFLNRFGAIASWLGLVEHDTVQAALDRQAEAGGRIGEHLREGGHLSEEQISTVLDLQKQFRQGADSSLLTFTVRFNVPLQGIPFLTLQGVLDGSALCSRRLNAALRAQPPGPLILSMAEVFYINRQGTTALMNGWARHPFVLVGVPELARPLLEQLGVKSLVPCFDQPRDALEFDFSSFETETVEGTHPASPTHTGAAPGEAEAEPLDVSVEEVDRITWIRISGVLDPLSAGRRYRRLLAALEENPHHRFAVDFTAVTRFASDALVFLGELPEGAEVVLVVTPALEAALKRLGLDACYPLFGECEAAQAALAAEWVCVEGGEVYHRRGCSALKRTRLTRLHPLEENELLALRPCKRCAGR